MVKSLKATYYKYHVQYINSRTGTDQFASLLDVCTTLAQVNNIRTARNILQKRLNEWEEYPFRAKVYREALADLG